jgi:hypothetical protein
MGHRSPHLRVLGAHFYHLFTLKVQRASPTRASGFRVSDLVARRQLLLLCTPDCVRAKGTRLPALGLLPLEFFASSRTLDGIGTNTLPMAWMSDGGAGVRGARS